MKMDSLLSLSDNIPPIDGSCYRIIDSSILQDIFSNLPQNVYYAMQKNVKVSTGNKRKLKEWELTMQLVG